MPNCLLAGAMSVLMTLRIALKALSRNKMRTSLTMLGRIIGVGAVITMSPSAAAPRPRLRTDPGRGTNMVTVFPETRADRRRASG